MKNMKNVNVFYTHGSVHRESNLVTVQQDAAYSVYYIWNNPTTKAGCSRSG